MSKNCRILPPEVTFGVVQSHEAYSSFHDYSNHGLIQLLLDEEDNDNKDPVDRAVRLFGVFDKYVRSHDRPPSLHQVLGTKGVSLSLIQAYAEVGRPLDVALIPTDELIARLKQESGTAVNDMPQARTSFGFYWLATGDDTGVVVGVKKRPVANITTGGDSSGGSVHAHEIVERTSFYVPEFPRVEKSPSDSRDVSFEALRKHAQSVTERRHGLLRDDNNKPSLREQQKQTAEMFASKIFMPDAKARGDLPLVVAVATTLFSLIRLEPDESEPGQIQYSGQHR